MASRGDPVPYPSWISHFGGRLGGWRGDAGKTREGVDVPGTRVPIPSHVAGAARPGILPPPPTTPGALGDAYYGTGSLRMRPDPEPRGRSGPLRDPSADASNSGRSRGRYCYRGAGSPLLPGTSSPPPPGPSRKDPLPHAAVRAEPIPKRSARNARMRWRGRHRAFYGRVLRFGVDSGGDCGESFRGIRWR